MENLHAQAAKAAAVSYQVQNAELARRYSHGVQSMQTASEQKLSGYGVQQRIRSKERDLKHKDSEVYGRTVSTGKNDGSSSGGRPASGSQTWAEVHDPMSGNQVTGKRAGSSGPGGGSHGGAFPSGTTGVGLHSSGGSIGAHSYRTINAPGMARSRTQGRIMNSQVKKNKLSQIICPCSNQPTHLKSGVSRGAKQPILMSSESTANCGQCGQFFAIKVSIENKIDQFLQESVIGSAQQGGSHLDIIRTVREKGTVFKLDQPINEIFDRMRKVSKEYLEILKPNSFYLTVSTIFSAVYVGWRFNLKSLILDRN